MFDCTPCYGHDVYIDDNCVGYIERLGDGDAAITISGRRFARLTGDGVLGRDGKIIGEVDDSGLIFFGERQVGEIDPDNNIVFYGDELR